MDKQKYESYALIIQKGAGNIGQFSPYIQDMGLVGVARLNDTDMLRLGLAISIRKRQVGWLWIDWMIAAEKKWGDLFPEVLALYGEYNVKTITDSINLGKYDFPLAKRKWKLSPTHYREVRSLPIEAQELLLSLAEKKGWSSSGTLRTEVWKIRNPGMEKKDPASPSDLNAEDEDTPPLATTLAEAFQTPQNVAFETQGDKPRVANQLALFLQRVEKLEYGYYTLQIALVKTHEFVIDNDHPMGVILNVDDQNNGE